MLSELWICTPVSKHLRGWSRRIRVKDYNRVLSQPVQLKISLSLSECVFQKWSEIQLYIQKISISIIILIIFKVFLDQRLENLHLCTCLYE